MKENNKFSYYSTFTTSILLGAKELLKSMPTFYTRVYFSSLYADALWNGEKEESFNDVILLTELKNVEMLRQIIKTNFLYIPSWDSLRNTDSEEYGFSFIAGNIKYVLMPFEETEKGYTVYSYNVDSKECRKTELVREKKFFLDTSIKENGEIVKTADFKYADINDQNTVTKKAQKKGESEMILYENKGYTLVNSIAILLIALLGSAAVYIAYKLMSTGIIG